MKTALNVIRDEHRSLAAVLHGLRYLVEDVREGRRKPDFTVLRAMVRPRDFAAFAEEVERYADFHWRHMRREEELVLPLAERALMDSDWREIDAAFAGNADPLIAKDAEKDFERLFKRIVNIAPPPIGVGREN